MDPEDAPARPVIAIDGPAGSGKSTLARKIASALGLPYVNTGLMYRALARRALDMGVDPDDGAGLRELLARMSFRISPSEDPPSLRLQGQRVDEFTDSEVERNVSAVARHPEVRSPMAELQRGLGASGAVMEGRDIGSVVFPGAAVKIYLDAAPEERAGRRVRERAGGPKVGEEVARRDARDARVNPFVPPQDASRIDT